MTTAIPQVKSVVEPELADLLLTMKRDIFATLHCVKVGIIKAFNGSQHTAQIQIVFKRVHPDGTNSSYPLLVDCPVFTLQGGGAALQLPIAAGDPCLVLFSDRRLDEWFQNGSEAAPLDGRLHDLSDGIALVGINALNSSLAATATNQVVLAYLNSQFKINAAGFTIAGSGGAEIDLQAAIVTIKNATTSLLTLLNGLITAIEGVQVVGNLALTPASVTALEAQKALLATLLA